MLLRLLIWSKQYWLGLLDVMVLDMLILPGCTERAAWDCCISDDALLLLGSRRCLPR
jgi:hypothetical protein